MGAPAAEVQKWVAALVECTCAQQSAPPCCQQPHSRSFPHEEQLPGLLSCAWVLGCRAALGEYELGLAYMVITASQRDPGEYMLQLQVRNRLHTFAWPDCAVCVPVTIIVSPLWFVMSMYMSMTTAKGWACKRPAADLGLSILHEHSTLSTAAAALHPAHLIVAILCSGSRRLGRRRCRSTRSTCTSAATAARCGT